MELFKLIMLGLCAAVLSLAVRQYRPDIALVLSLCAGLTLAAAALSQFSGMTASLGALAQKNGIETQYLKIGIKVVCVAFLCDFAVNLCRDAGESAIASRVELAGKLTLVSLALPAAERLVELVCGLITL